ncbi:MAG TPA: hypothetical protein VJI46_03215 [Candidatus Nanoarchaeia archaeon]|nr:hypothetical protein [Candidatus Nanoarchaeia archaeon]
MLKMGFSKAKRVFFVGIALLLLFSMPALSQPAPQGEGALEKALKAIYDLFSFLPEKLTPDALAKGEPESQAIFYAKFILFIFVYAVLVYVATPIFKESKGVRVTVPFIISLMSVILIPNAIVADIFKTYSIVGAFLIWILPIIGVLLLNHRIKETLGDNWVTYFFLMLSYGLLIWLVTNLDKNIRVWIPAVSAGMEYFDLVLTVLYIFFLHAIWKLLWGVFGGPARTAGEWAATTGPSANPFKWFKAKTEAEKKEAEITKGVRASLKNVRQLSKAGVETEADLSRIIADLNAILQFLKSGRTIENKDVKIINEKLKDAIFYENKFAHAKLIQQYENEVNIFKTTFDNAKRIRNLKMKGTNTKNPVRSALNAEIKTHQQTYDSLGNNLNQLKGYFTAAVQALNKSIRDSWQHLVSYRDATSATVEIAKSIQILEKLIDMLKVMEEKLHNLTQVEQTILVLTGEVSKLP